MDNLTRQIEEIEALSAIYNDDFQTEDEVNRAYSIKIVNSYDNNIYIKLYVKIPDSYPSMSPPTFEISAPHLKQDKKLYFSNLLEDIYLSHIGQTVIFQWIEKIREELNTIPLELVNEIEEKESQMVLKVSMNHKENEVNHSNIIHGEVILDRKSSFQGHTAAVFSVEHVMQVLSTLKENRKIQQATHNIYAFRIYNEKTKSFIHDCDDDGEVQAGSRLLHLLEIMDVKNAIVVVSRWYGGIHLGPDRFRHINNAARQVLSVANFIPNQK